MGHEHPHEQPGKGRAFAIGIAMNLGFVVVEVVYGLLSHSVALLSDAGHNLSDVLGLGLSWGATILATAKPSKRRTYGMRKASILAALGNSLILVAATGALAWESISRVREPTEVHGLTVVVVAAAGVLVNGSSALLFMRGRKSDLNVRSAFLHLAGDAAIAAGVAIAGVVILFTGWNVLDPVVSLVVSLLVLLGAWRLLRSSVNLAVDAVPEGIDLDQVRAVLSETAGVEEVHDLHVWSMSTTETALTAHIVLGKMPTDNTLVRALCKHLHAKFEIAHATIQLEGRDGDACDLAPDECV